MEKNWFKLDNAAKIYPPTRTRNRAAMFRMSVTLDEEVDLDVLKQALADSLKRFPSFSCRMSHGVFWYYLEKMNGIPPIKSDVKNPMAPLRPKENDNFLFRVRYFKNRIAIEFFHVIADGTGGLTFLLSLIARYIEIKESVKIPTSKFVFSCEDEPLEEEYEDSFLKYARKETVSRNEKTAYHLSGTAIEFNQLLLISGTCETNKLLALAKKYNVSLGVFLTSLLIDCIAKKQKEEHSKSKRKKPIKVSVPVNLRQFYPTKTLRNFSSYVNTSIETRLGDYSFEEILNEVKHIMGLRLTEKSQNATFSENVGAERNLFIRLMPLFLKNPVMKALFLLQGDRYVSSTLSNMGVIEVPDEMKKHIERIDFLLGKPSVLRTDCACISYNGKTVFNFSRTTKESDVERLFFTSLVKMGVNVFIESNGRYM